MSYQPYLIANFATGLDVHYQPWLSADDAQEELYDGFVYRGTMSKRNGYVYFANGLSGGAPYRESRIVHTLTAIPMVGAINSSNHIFTLAGTSQIARGSVTITGSTPSQIVIDDGFGNLTGAGTGTVDYVTGAISVTFTAAPTAGTVTVTYSFMPALPVMMIANYYDALNKNVLVVADTTYINKYDPETNTLVDITTTPYNPGDLPGHNFFTWVNYPDANSKPRLLFSNNVDVIQQYDGTTVAPYAYTPFNSSTGAPITFLTCLLMCVFKDRLLLFRVTENSNLFPQRIRISGTGTSCDNFNTSATGAGFIDIPDGTWIFGIAFNRDDVIIFTEGSTWVLKYTGDDTKPFVLNRIDESRGSQAPFAAITYLNRTTAASPRGLIATDGYKVDRTDEEIPDFSFDEVDDSNFDLCFAGTVDEDRDHYLIYPSSDQSPTVKSDRILITNYDEFNYSIYRIPLSCMGSYLISDNITWNDFLPGGRSPFNNWEEFALVYSNWNKFGFQAAVPFAVGGGQNGEIWRLNVTESEDNPVRIYNITVVSTVTNVLEITTDFNNYSMHNGDDSYEAQADVIFFTGISGMLELNNQQFPIVQIVSPNVFRVQADREVVYSAFTTDQIGEAIRVIPFSALMKQFNPFVAQDKKVRCGWVYMYVDSAGTDLTDNLQISNVILDNPLVIATNVDHGLTTGEKIQGIFGVVGTTQLNSLAPTITVETSRSFSLDGIDGTAFTPYVSGGYVSFERKEKLFIDVFTNDNDTLSAIRLQNLPPPEPFQGNCTNLSFEKGGKKWYKVYINQTGKFLQFRFRNVQAGATVKIQAFMPGFQSLGRLI